MAEYETMTKAQANIVRAVDANVFMGLRHITEQISCPVHGSQQVVLIDWGRGFPFPVCPVCDEEQQQEVRKRDQQIRRESEWEQCGIAREFFGATVAGFVVQSKSQRAARDAVKELCKGKINKVVLLGKNGVGKTHLACAAVKHLGGRIITAFELGLKIRATYTKSSSKSELDVLDALVRLPFLALDELGRSKNSEAMKDWLSYVLGKRHSASKPFMICTNAHLAADCPAGGCDGCFENLVGSDVLSRLQQDSRIVSLADTGDWRAKQ